MVTASNRKFTTYGGGTLPNPQYCQSVAAQAYTVDLRIKSLLPMADNRLACLCIQ